MSLVYPAPSGTVPGWEEITRQQNSQIGRAISLLQQTNAGSGYADYSVSILRRKMNNPQTTPNLAYPGLRAWRHTTRDIVALFVLRAWNATISDTPAYSLTVGVGRTITTSVYNDLLPLCQWMIGQPPLRMEIISENDPISHPALAATFADIPQATILGYDTIYIGHPWPNQSVHRWRLHP
jgi:hypothetical protein